MRKIGLIATVLAVVLVAGCGARRGGSTPESTFQIYKSAMTDQNFADVWELLSAASRQRMQTDAQTLAEHAVKAEGPERAALEMTAKSIGMTLDDMKKTDGKTFFIAMLKMAALSGRDEWAQFAHAEFSRADVDGGRAVVHVAVDGRDETMPLVSENGSWMIDLTAVPVTLAEPPAAPAAPVLQP